MTKHQDFTVLHHGQRPFVLPNAWDVASALLLQEAGFAAVATTSLGGSSGCSRPRPSPHERPADHDPEGFGATHDANPSR